MLSSHILWECVKDSSCFIRKQRGVNKAFTREPFNLWGTHNFLNCGFIRKQALDISPAVGGKGVLLTLRKKSKWRKPKKAAFKVPVVTDSRRTMKTIASVLRNNHYPRRMKRPAQIRASQILRSQMVKATPKRRRQRREKQKK
uniref:Large ribosomal subunit protein eL28 n=1 Tax=Trichuris muris TaxID=70415 RepID=A0A5S6R3R2_TRIMR